MGKDPKVYVFNKKEDLIIYTNLIIEISIKHLDRHKRYLAEMKNLIADNDKIKYRDYKVIEDKLKTPQNYLLNLFGDRSLNSASYFRIRKVLKEKSVEFNIQYSEHNQEIRELMNSLSSARNYEHHFTDAKIMEWGLYRKSQLSDLPNIEWPTEQIIIYNYEYMEIDSVTINFDAYETMQEVFVTLLQLLKKDYSLMVGKSIQIERKQRTSMNSEDVQNISLNGVNRHLGKKK